MINYIIDESFHRSIGHSSLGRTNKYYKDGYWYKINVGGFEGKSERICSMLLKHSNITNFVEYEECLINGEDGCRSKSFIHDGESVVTFQRLYELISGGKLGDKVYSYSSVTERIAYVLDFIYEYTGLDCKNYLQTALNFDMLCLNVDRHFQNLAIIQTSDGWREAPLFDFSVSFFSLQKIFPPEMSIEDKRKKMTPQPFSNSFEEQAMVLGSNILLNYQAIQKEVEKESEYIKEIVNYQLNKYKSYFPDIHSADTGLKYK